MNLFKIGDKVKVKKKYLRNVVNDSGCDNKDIICSIGKIYHLTETKISVQFEKCFERCKEVNSGCRFSQEYFIKNSPTGKFIDHDGVLIQELE